MSDYIFELNSQTFTTLSSLRSSYQAFSGDGTHRNNPDSTAVAAVGRDCLRIVGYGYAFYGLGMVMETSFNGAGDTWTPTYLNFLIFWVFEIPLAYVLAYRFGWGPQGVFWAITLAFSLLAVSAALLFRRGKWKLKTV